MLSNMFPAKIKLWNKCFPSSEHAYQFSKLSFLEFHSLARKILTTKSPYDAKRMSKIAGTSLSWEENKRGFMSQVLEAKYQQCKRFRQFLESSRGKRLVENTANYYWGRGPCGKGLNTLGKILMELRHTHTKGL